MIIDIILYIVIIEYISDWELLDLESVSDISEFDN